MDDHLRIISSRGLTTFLEFFSAAGFRRSRAREASLTFGILYCLFTRLIYYESIQ